MTVMYRETLAEPQYDDEERASAYAHTRLRVGAFEIDFDRFELRRNGVRVEIQPLVLDLLVHLLINRGRVVTRDELIAAVWRGTLVGDGAIHQAISILRKVIGDGGRDGLLLETVHKRGYMLMTSRCTCESTEGAR